MQIDKQQPMRECEIQIVDYINAGNIASLDDVNDAVNVEKERAVTRENELEAEIKAGGDVKQALDAEIERATTKENELESAINTNEQAISNEVTRATGKESELNSAIIAETSRATTKENELESAINANEQAISNEVTRATSKENELNSAITAETSRATAKENELESAINANEQAISNEVTRATSKESELDAKFDDYALLDSPALTGTPTAPTATKGTSSTQVATTEFVSNAVSGVTPEIADGSITSNKLADGAVIPSKVYNPTKYSDNDAIIQSKNQIKNWIISDLKLAEKSVLSEKIADGAVIPSKVYNPTKYSDNDAIIQSENQIKNGIVTSNKLETSLQTLVSFVKTLPAMEWGYSSSSYTIAAGATQSVTVKFSSTKSEAPSVFVDTQANVDALILSSVKSVTTTQFVVLLKNESDTSVSNITFDYLALSAR